MADGNIQPIRDFTIPDTGGLLQGLGNALKEQFRQLPPDDMGAARRAFGEDIANAAQTITDAAAKRGIDVDLVGDLATNARGFWNYDIHTGNQKAIDGQLINTGLTAFYKDEARALGGIYAQANGHVPPEVLEAYDTLSGGNGYVTLRAEGSAAFREGNLKNTQLPFLGGAIRRRRDESHSEIEQQAPGDKAPASVADAVAGLGGHVTEGPSNERPGVATYAQNPKPANPSRDVG